MKVAFSAARGLSFLHEAKVIYRDFKASNILLDVVRHLLSMLVHILFRKLLKQKKIESSTLLNLE